MLGAPSPVRVVLRGPQELREAIPLPLLSLASRPSNWELKCPSFSQVFPVPTVHCLITAQGGAKLVLTIDSSFPGGTEENSLLWRKSCAELSTKKDATGRGQQVSKAWEESPISNAMENSEFHCWVLSHPVI